MAKRTLPHRLSRDTILFFSGLGGIGWVTFSNGGDRPTLLVLFGAMVGLPAFLRVDESRTKGQPPPAPVKDQTGVAP